MMPLVTSVIIIVYATEQKYKKPKNTGLSVIYNVKIYWHV